MPRTDTASRVIAASPERVYAAFIDPQALVAWLPPDGMTPTFERFDLRPVSDDPAFAGMMIMTWQLTPVDGATRVDFIPDSVPEGISPEDHAVGLSTSLANLADYVER